MVRWKEETGKEEGGKAEVAAVRRRKRRRKRSLRRSTRIVMHVEWIVLTVGKGKDGQRENGSRV